MEQIVTDIFISGAGLAGMILAARLAERGFDVTICDPATPPEDPDAEGSDLRSTAYLEPSRRVLEAAGLWQDLAPHAQPLGALQVIDTTGWPPEIRTRRTFRPDGLDLAQFGYNIPNWRAHKLLAGHLATRAGVDLRLGVGFSDMLARDRDVRVTLTDGSTLTARLVVGADGRNSPVRGAMGIDVRTRRYGQKAFAFAVTHARPHGNVSTEIYNSGGAFTTVPLPDHDGRHASAIVWMNDAARARALNDMDRGAFEAELNLRSTGELGEMRQATDLRLWPIITQTAHALTARRAVLVAEAAHVLPPIGAQGLNTSVSDISALADALDPDDPGAQDALDRYARGRKTDMALRAGVIDLFNRICQSDNSGLQGLRRLGLQAVHDIAPVRERLMRLGLGGAG